MSRNRSPLCRTLPFFATVAVMAITASGADSLLLHRWSFNNDFTDSAGGQTATATNYSFVAYGSGYAVKMQGGASGTSFVDLGKDILPNALPPQKMHSPLLRKEQGFGIIDALNLSDAQSVFYGFLQAAWLGSRMARKRGFAINSYVQRPKKGRKP